MQSASEEIKRAIALFGPTRAGKTTFLNNLLRDGEYQQVGKIGGRSTTRQCRAFVTKTYGLFPEKKMLIIDTIGLDDTDRVFSNEQICELVMEQIFKKSKLTSFHIIVFESLQNKSILPLTYKSLVEMLGPKSAPSATVLATKADLSHRIMNFAGRLQTVKDETAKHRFSACFPWSNKKTGDISKDAQMIQLAQHLRRVAPFASEQLQSLKDCVTKMAIKLQEEAGPRKKEILANQAQDFKQERTVLEEKVQTQQLQKQSITYKIHKQVSGGGWFKAKKIQYIATPVKKMVKDVKYLIDHIEKTVTEVIPVLKTVKKDVEFQKLPLWVFQEIAHNIVEAQFFGN